MPNKAKIEAMQNEIAELRHNLAELIFEIDQSIFHESKYLEKEYMEKIGHLELKSFKIQCSILRIRRKIEIVKELIDNNRYLDLEFVEKILDIDFEEYDDKIQISIKDQGVGIKQEDIDRIFERFYRIDKSRNRNNGGSGLGLAIVKHILEAHKQKIYVTSKIGKGSTFSFYLQKA